MPTLEAAEFDNSAAAARSNNDDFLIDEIEEIINSDELRRMGKDNPTIRRQETVPKSHR